VLTVQWIAGVTPYFCPIGLTLGKQRRMIPCHWHRKRRQCGRDGFARELRGVERLGGSSIPGGPSERPSLCSRPAGRSSLTSNRKSAAPKKQLRLSPITWSMRASWHNFHCQAIGCSCCQELPSRLNRVRPFFRSAFDFDNLRRTQPEISGADNALELSWMPGAHNGRGYGRLA